MSARSRRQVVDALIEGAFLQMVQNPRHAKPGELITRLPAHMREICKTLTSADFNHRLEFWMTPEPKR